MACVSADLGEGRVLHVCRVDGERRPVRKRRRRLWCFKCRKHTLHMLMKFFSVEPSYYDPNFWYECPTCQGDYTRFPGWWED